MTDAPRRTISGLTPRATAQTGGVERLLKKNRPQASDAPEIDEPVAPAPTPEPTPATAPAASPREKYALRRPSRRPPRSRRCR